MRRLARTPMVAALSCGVMAAAGCSGGGSTAPRATIVPAQSVRAGRMTQEFAAVRARTPQEAEAVRDFRRAVIIFDASEAGSGMVPGASRYVTGHALGNLTAAVTALAKHHTVSTGTSRIFDVAVTVAGKQAALSECDDVRQNIDIVTTTGKAAPGFPPPPDQSFLKVAWLLRRTGGHWAVILLGVGATNQNKTCQPKTPKK